jgi:sulfide dehydrogenase cytochrome subunit
MIRSAQGVFCAALMAAAFLQPARAAPAAPPAGAIACSGCHGVGGDSAMPSLAGQSAEQIASAMRGFKTGDRPATLMGRIARGFSDDELDAIARWLANR